MLTGKDRRFLRSKANTLSDVIHVGKDGINENIIKQTEGALKARELIKGKLQQNCLEDVKEVAEVLSKATQSEIVGTIGSKFILYKKNKDKNQYGV